MDLKALAGYSLNSKNPYQCYIIFYPFNNKNFNHGNLISLTNLNGSVSAWAKLINQIGGSGDDGDSKTDIGANAPWSWGPRGLMGSGQAILTKD